MQAASDIGATALCPMFDGAVVFCPVPAGVVVVSQQMRKVSEYLGRTVSVKPWPGEPIPTFAR
eukprot:2216232-Pyramimonas_sp.AAC.1